MYSIDSIEKYIWNNFRKLTNLELCLRLEFEVRQDHEFVLNDEPKCPTHVTNNIKYLEFQRPHRTLDSNKNFVGMFGGLKYVRLQLGSKQDLDILQHISATKDELESLSLWCHSINLEVMSEIRFKSLKKISIDHHDYFMSHEYEKALTSLIASHAQTLEGIYIGHDISKSIVNEIEKCKKLSYLKIITGRYVNDVLVDRSLKSAVKMLHEVPLNKKQFTLALSYKTFKFPDDQIFWDEIINPPATFANQIEDSTDYIGLLLMLLLFMKFYASFFGY